MNKSSSGILRSALAGSLVMAGLAFAQSGIAGGQDGLHQIGANTLGQWNVSFGVGGDLSFDSWSMASGGVMVAKPLSKGNQKDIDLNGKAISFTSNLNFAVGLTDWMDLGVNLPILFDYATDHGDVLSKTKMNDVGLGDLEAWMKIRAVGNDASLFKLALLGQLYAPTGDDDAGIRPRHAWYLESGNGTKPFSADCFAFGGGLVFTFDFAAVGAPVRWNSQVGFIYPTDHHYLSKTLTYSTGVNVSPVSMLDLFLEFSGEMRLDDTAAPMDPTIDPMLITPGLRFHLNDHTDLALGFEFAPRVFKNLDFDADKEIKETNSYKVRNEEDGVVYKYGYVSTPSMALAASLVWRFGSKVPDSKARQDSLIMALADSLAKVKVDSIMATIDTTTKVKVDTVAKVDTIAKVDTVAKIDTIAKVDTVKVIDLTADSLNKAKMDSVAAVNDSLAKLAADDDKDGVPNMMDKCPGTPAGIKVGPDGCEVDTDGDGVVDSQDKCPASNAGAPVDANGCEFDDDSDGVVNAKDACPRTLSEAAVDQEGCPTNKNEDLEYLQGQVKFKKGSTKFAKGATKALDQVAALMQHRENLRIEVQGHSDEAKTPEKNKDLSYERAKAVANYLVKKGVPSKHLRPTGFGDTQLLVLPKPAKKGKKAKPQSNPKNNRVVFMAFEVAPAN